ncbi:MAG: response regulator [Candidatus Marinimicrobia bacterium]|nr:response regulator [Candidatus Neomarinimicrobiota bacterium]
MIGSGTVQFKPIKAEKSGREKVLFIFSKAPEDAPGLEDGFLFKLHVVIVDILMPNVDGFSLIKKIREVKGLKDIKLIVVSAKTFDFDQNRVYELDANVYLIKPIKCDKFQKSIERLERLLQEFI